MLQNWLTYLTGFSAIYCWLVAGVFLAFSDFVMRSLGAIPPAQGIMAMQSINILVFRSIFAVGLIGLSLLSVLFLVLDLFQGQLTARSIAAVIYLVGVVFVTGAGNIPLNDALAAVDPTTSSAHSLWDRYLKVWVYWNHVRTVGAVLAAMLLTFATFQAA